MKLNIETITIIIQSVLAITTVGAWLLNRRESRSKIKNMDALTKKTETETEKIKVDENLILFQQLQVERTENEKAQKRISKDITNLQEDLRITNQSLSNAVTRELAKDAELTRYKKVNEDLMIEQQSLRKNQIMTNKIVQQHEGKIEKIKRDTGELLKTPFTNEQLK